jgi:hypothetical protein
MMLSSVRRGKAGIVDYSGIGTYMVGAWPAIVAVHPESRMG